MSRQQGGAGGAGNANNSFFTLDDEVDLLGLGTQAAPAAAGAPPPHQHQHHQQQQQHQHQQPTLGRQQQQQPQTSLIDLLDAPLAPIPTGSSSTGAGAGQPLQGAQASAQQLLGSPVHPHQHQQQRQQASMSEVLSLRLGSQSGADPAGTHRQGSLGYGEFLWLGDEPTEHPIDAPAGADATLLLASGSSGAAAAAAAVGASGGEGGRGRGRAPAVEGVHGGDRHLAEDEYARTVQVQTISGEGVLTRWQRFLKAAGVRRRRPPGAFAGNELVTSKYNLLNFVPVNLYHQFKRVANMYFAALVCLQAVPGLSPVPWWGTLFPLAVVLLVNGVKEAFDDYWRHKSDEQVNHRWVTALKEDGDQRIHWKSLQVGELVRLSNNEDVPADIVLLASSDPEGLCYVETANLDGETNLKVKFCNPQTAGFDCAEAFSRAGYLTIDCEAPNPRLYFFEGAICRWDVPPTHHLSHRPPIGAQHPRLGAANGLGGAPKLTAQQQRQLELDAVLQEVEMQGAAAAPGAGSQGWYRSEQEQQQQQQQQRRSKPGSPLGRRSGSPSRREQQGVGGLQRPQSAAAAGNGDSLTAALSSYGRQVGLVSRDGLDASNLLLRGCTLRKTEWVIGVVVFTGPDTKVVRNMLPAPRKVTRLEQAMNRVVIVVLATLGTAAVALGTANMVWEVRHKPRQDWYLGEQTGWPELAPGVGSWLVQVVRFIILLAQAVPISLYVSLETVKVAQCKLLYDRDLKMYYPPEDVPCTSRTTTLNEELGQVQYVLSDKTGTLTQNVMGFVWASIGGKMYGQAQHAHQAAAHAALRRQRRPPAGGGNGSKGMLSAGTSAAAAGAASGSSKGSAAAAAARSPSPIAGSGAGVVITAQDDGPPPNTPHTIALDPELRQAAAGAAAAAAATGAGGSNAGAAAGAAAAAAVHDFLLALAVCNTVVPTATDQGHLLYQAASPDEEALVAGAAYLGTKLVARSAAGIEIEVNGQLHRLELLAVLEFSSDRKRMSVVVRQHDLDGGGGDSQYHLGGGSSSGGRLRLLCKGADNVMLERLKGHKLSPDEAAVAQPLLASTSSHLASMAAAGYRTLVVAAKDLDEGSYASWASRYKAACASSTNRASKVGAVCEELEAGLTLLGATAVEDKLQEGVPESIAALSAAGIKVWVLTGDKMETAISIGHTARLLHQRMAILRVKEADLHPDSSTPAAAAAAAAVGSRPGRQQQQQQPRPASPAAAAGVDEHGVPVRDDRVLQAVQRLADQAKALQTGGGGSAAAAAAASAASAAVGGAGGGSVGVGLVVDGGALALLLNPQHEDAFLALATSCDAVICCRVSPMQKAQVATLLKRKAGAVTLAIGDGANDVSMIQAAHIGVGISGREGRAAVQAADFAFGQFRFLVRLLLLHGRQSYLRCREVVLYAFYKNVAYVSCFVLFSFYSGFSAQSVFFPLYIATFNAVWAAYPTLGYGLFEQDVPGELAIAYPQLYSETRCQTARDFYRAWLLWCAIGLWHGAACFYVPVAALARRGAVSGSGTHVTVTSYGTAVMTAVIITVNLRVAIRTTHWTVINHALIWGTLALWLPFLGLLTGLCGSVAGLAPLCGVGSDLLTSPSFWLSSVFGAPAAALLLDLTIMVFQRTFKPRPSQILQEIEAVRAKQRRQGIMAGLPPAAGAGAAAGAAAAGAAAAGLQQLPQHSPGLEQQLRASQQHQQQGALPVSSSPAPPPAAPAAAAAAPMGRGRGGGIFALAHVPSTAAADAMAAAEEGAPASFDGWGGAGGVPSYFSMGADYNMGGPHTLGDLAAGIEWAPTLITASPAVLAASQTKRQSALPHSAARAAPVQTPAAAAAAAAAASGDGSGRPGGGHGHGGGRAGPAGLWSLGRSGSGGSDAFGPAVAPAAGTRQQQHQQQQQQHTGGAGAIAMQPLPTLAAHPAPQQQQQVLPGSPSAAGVRARPSRLGNQQQQSGTSSGGRAPQFTLGGDDTL